MHARLGTLASEFVKPIRVDKKEPSAFTPKMNHRRANHRASLDAARTFMLHVVYYWRRASERGRWPRTPLLRMT